MSVRLLLNIARPWGEGDPLRLAASAVAAGADGVGFADSPRLFPDPWLEADRFLAAEPNALAGPCVLGLGLHHPSVVAQGALTLHRHHPGRALVVVGRGESSVRNENLPVPSLAAYQRALDELRDRTPDGSAAGLPVLGAASGPRTIAVTAVRLPGVLIDAGSDPAVIAKAVSTARAEKPDVQCWLFLRAVATASPAEQESALAPLLGSCAARLAAAPDWYDVPAAQRPDLALVAAGYDYRRHGTVSSANEVSSSNGPAAGTAALIRDRFLLTGDADSVAARLRPVADLGIGGVVLAGATAGLTDHLGATLAAVRAALTPPQPEPEGARQ